MNIDPTTEDIVHTNELELIDLSNEAWPIKGTDKFTYPLLEDRAQYQRTTIERKPIVIHQDDIHCAKQLIYVKSKHFAVPKHSEESSKKILDHKMKIYKNVNKALSEEAVIFNGIVGDQPELEDEDNAKKKIHASEKAATDEAGFHYLPVKSPIHGYGLIAARYLRGRGDIINYKGQCISSGLVSIRENRLLNINMMSFYTFRLHSPIDDTDLYCFIRDRYLTKQTYDHIDATFLGNFARLANHSCDPTMSSDEDISGREIKLLYGKPPTIGLESEKESGPAKNLCAHIKAGQELTFRYLTGTGNDFQCNCGAANCISKQHNN